MPDCADTIAALRESWNFVAVTARWGWLPRARANTETWLAAHGMSMPVYYAPRPYPQDADRAVFKKGVIEGIGRGGEHGPVLAGVGDRPSDMVAYTGKSTSRAALVSAPCREWGVGVHRWFVTVPARGTLQAWVGL